jgi:hypothetical protein
MVDFVELMEPEEALLGGRISDYKPAQSTKPAGWGGRRYDAGMWRPGRYILKRLPSLLWVAAALLWVAAAFLLVVFHWFGARWEGEPAGHHLLLQSDGSGVSLHAGGHPDRYPGDINVAWPGLMLTRWEWSTGGYGAQYRVTHWLLYGITLIPPLAWMLLRHLRASRLNARYARGLCPECGYDLRASPGRCPECGTARA